MHPPFQEGLATAEIARRLGRAEATIKTYLYDPTGDKTRTVKACYRGVCRGCGAPTAPRNGKSDAYACCNCCYPSAIAPKWIRERVRDAMRAWRARYGAAPSSYDWSRTHARRRGREALKRLRGGEWPAPSTVIDLYGASGKHRFQRIFRPPSVALLARRRTSGWRCRSHAFALSPESRRPLAFARL